MLAALAETEKKNLLSLHKLVFVFLVSTLTVFGQTEDDLNKRPLPIGQTVEREMTGGQTHRYEIESRKNELFQVSVVQLGIDVAVRFLDAGGKKLAEGDSPNGTHGFEVLSFIAPEAGNYTVEVVSSDGFAKKNKYTIFLETPRIASDNDRRQIQADSIYREAIVLLMSGGDRAKALEKFKEANQIYREVGYKRGETQSIYAVGFVYDLSAQKPAALKSYEQALLLAREIKDVFLEAAILHNAGTAYSGLDQYQKALENLNQSLSIHQAVGNKKDETEALIFIGQTYSSLGERKKALEAMNQALLVIKATGDKVTEARVLYNIAQIYAIAGERQKALEYYNQVLPFFKAEDKSSELLVIKGIAQIYLELGERQKALEYYNQAISLNKAVGNKSSEASTLSSIGALYKNSGDNQKALEYYNQALSLQKSIGFRRGEATTLSNIGVVYKDTGEHQKAIDYFNQALQISRDIGAKDPESSALAKIGDVYQTLGEYQKAIDHYNQSLVITRKIGDKDGEIVVLNYLMRVWNVNKNPRFAVFYGKQSINGLQKMRSNIVLLKKEVQQTYLKSIETNYRTLAEQLLEQGRLSEAQQVLNSFKDQQFYDFENSNAKQPTAIALSVRESDFIARYEKTSDSLGETGFRVEEYKRKIGRRQPSKEEVEKLQKLESEAKLASDNLIALLTEAETEFSKPADEKDRIGEIPDVTQMQTALRQLNTQTKQKAVTVYQLVGREQFRALIVTENNIASVSIPIKNTVLNEKAKQFWTLLQSPVYDPANLGKELYGIVFKPIEKELPKDTQTIMWSLDGNLRYVPMAALHDGKSYLVERYNHVNFTRADNNRITQAVSPRWTGLGFGSSKAQTVEMLGDKISFSALPGVAEELKEIFKQADSKSGILEGETRKDDEFTKANFLAALKQKRPLVHIASHFAFSPGDESRSFLLMGDGTAFTLEEMKREKDLFQNVELLTLSACNTAAQQPDATGRDVDAFFELAQRLGANAVLATLWSVADNSTPWLMRDFYATRESKNGANKAEALRQAQLELLNGTAKTKPLPFAEKSAINCAKVKVEIIPDNAPPERDQTRSDVMYLNGKDAPLYKRNEKKPFAHPYYWSPFVLIGNWR